MLIISAGEKTIQNRNVDMVKITFMGAGSTVFARNVLGDCMCREALKGSHFALYDIDGERLRPRTFNPVVCEPQSGGIGHRHTEFGIRPHDIVVQDNIPHPFPSHIAECFIIPYPPPKQKPDMYHPVFDKRSRICHTEI